ncbi:MAG: hypothetical protein BECKG1743D_GA0114223_101625 [Candidatus Kentron sp. G]|nr:MAG: hypothetical protein BECKG1743F_GA0114225_101345 [Candidatus Kentron sp. G]VFN00008.1 MAG: hypothetical protein BECKG1743D_GA0114223_101625 [Candidatus Kentron sp. G]
METNRGIREESGQIVPAPQGLGSHRNILALRARIQTGCSLRGYRFVQNFYSSERGTCKSQIVFHNEAKTSEKAEFTWK